jgi:pimeloyl-ACP methyl ester carboxylesterase
MDRPIFEKPAADMRFFPKTPLRHIAPIAIASFLVTGCTPYASISERRPIFPASIGQGELAKRLETALLTRKRQPAESLAALLLEARDAARALEADPANSSARDTYNFAVARVVETLQQSKLAPWTNPLQVGDFVLTAKKDPRPGWDPSLYKFVPADQFDIHGKYVAERSTKAGIGAPLVAIGREKNSRAREDFALPHIFYGVTAVIRFRGQTAELAFEDPLATETVSFHGRRLPLAADFTVPLAVMLQQAEPKKFELSRMLQPAKFAETARISRLQPYDPNKTVVLVIHGLMDTPATWTPLINRLRADESIRRHFQFWFYSYPSGYPYPYSASILRRQLDAVQKKYPLRKPMVVIGHSMGGCISRLLITDPGQELWKKLIGRPVNEAALEGTTRDILTESLIFKSRPEVGRVIFVAAPLRGSDLATHWLGRIGSSLIQPPQLLLQVGRDAMSLATFQGDDLRLRRMPNSIDHLAPNNRFVRAINSIPMNSRVPVHVISGDRGKGGNSDKTPPVKSDGIVPYWSSHIPTAVSEKVVPSDHAAHQNPEAIAEITRILKSHSAQQTLAR